jgi:hypothetical protein
MSRWFGLVALVGCGLLAAQASAQGEKEKAKYYHIVCLDTGKVLDVADGSGDNGAKIVVNKKGDSKSQHWEVVKAGDYVKFVNRKSGKVLDVPELSKEEGVDLIQWEDNGGENQQWKVEKLPKEKGDKGNTIKSRCSGLVLDVAGASKDDGAGVIQWGLHGDKNQQWELVEVK